MEPRRRVAIWVAAAGLALAVLLALGGPFGGAGGGGGRGAGTARLAGLFARDASYKAPPGQPAVTNLKVDRLRDAFNSAAREPRVIMALSPT